jgi:hypothetical protein
MVRLGDEYIRMVSSEDHVLGTINFLHSPGANDATLGL